MSKAVKVPEALYAELCQDALRRGSTVMDSLGQRMATANEETRRLRGEQGQLERSLDALRHQLAALDGARRTEVGRWAAEGRRLRTELSKREESLRERTAHLRKEQEEAASLREQLSAEEERATKYEKECASVSVILVLLVLGGLAWLMAKEFRRREETPPQEISPREPVPPPMYPAWRF